MTRPVLTVVGSSGTFPANGRACASYLLEAAGSRLLLDCGNGALSKLTQVCDVVQLDAVLLSHLHPDHFVDLYGLYYALRLHPDAPQSVDVYAPAGAAEHIGQLMSDYSPLGEFLRFHEVAAGDRFGVGGMKVELFAAAHPIETLATRITAGGSVLAYSGDSGPSPQLVECARDAHLFIADSTWLESGGPYPEALHMTGAQAGQHAQEAGAAALLVTHVFPSNAPAAVAAEAASRFDGRVIIAEDLEEHSL